MVVLSILLSYQLVHSTEISTKCTIAYNICFLQDDIKINDGDILKIIAPNPNSIIELYFNQGSKIGSIPLGTIDNFPHLLVFDISGSGIDSIQSDRLLHADRLQDLRLNNNDISIVPRKAFANNPNLWQIYLQENRIETIEDNAFEGVMYLSVLRLDQNLITTVGRSTFAGAPLIGELQLAYNRIEVIEDGALNLPQLKELNLAGNKLKVVSELALVAPNLVSLDLDANPMEDVNFIALASLEKLESLFLSDLKLKFSTEIPQYLPNKSKLTHITLNNNGLLDSDILKRLSLFGQLENIFARNNSFTDLKDVEHLRNYFPQLKLLSLEANTPPLCNWIKSNQQWLNGIKVWSGNYKFFERNQNMCGSADFTIRWYINTFIHRI